MKARLFVVLIGYAVLFAFGQANAAQILDQNQAASNTNMAGFNQGDLAQSFQQTANNISGAGVTLYNFTGQSDQITISLWDALPNQSGAVQLATATAVATSSLFDVYWSTPVATTLGNTYFLEFSSGSSSLSISGDTGNPYSFGQVYANSGFESFSSFDYTFRTFSDDTFGVSAVPEPAEWALLLAGLGVVNLVAKRRKG
jgi:hypothetical protein